MFIMLNKKPASKLSIFPQIAGIIDSMASMKAALRLDAGDLDFFEVRVDAFAGPKGGEDKVLAALPKLKLPLIITVRHPLEGGLHGVSAGKRRESFERFLPHAKFIDVELRSVKSLAGILTLARKKKVSIILSYHNFVTTPPANRLRALEKAAHAAGASILKVATVVSTPEDMAALLSLAHPKRKTPVSLMGMGPFGKVSRLVLAQAGSVLNYGFLDKAQVRGQWPAVLLKQRILELLNA